MNIQPWRRKPKRKALWVQVRESLGGGNASGTDASGSGSGPSSTKRFTAAPRRSRPLRRVSPGRQKLSAIYKRMAKSFLATHRKCAVKPAMDATEVHHMRGRDGTLYIDKRFFLAVSEKSHNRIHRNVGWARRKGLIGPWGKAPNDAETARLREIIRECAVH